MSGTLTTKHHDWASSFLGVDTRIGAPVAPGVAPKQAGGGLPPAAAPVSFEAPWPPAPVGPFYPPQTAPAQAPPAPAPAPPPAPAPAAATAPTVNIVPFPITANSVADFMNQAHAHFGGNKLGETGATPSYDGLELVPAGDRVAKLSLKLAINVSYATFGGGKPDANNETAIKDLAVLLKAHEERHCQGFKGAWSRWDAAKVTSDLMARTFKNAQDVEKGIEAEVVKLQGMLHDACISLHSTEGIYTPTRNPDGTFTIIATKAGPSGCT